MEKYYLICYRCQLQILEALEIGLDLPPTTLTKRHDQQENEMRLAHYPAVPMANLLPDANGTRIAKHTDFGSITLLFQDSVGGLEIENPAFPGQYDPVISTKIDEMIVNLGDCLQRWSNDRLRSTRHRVHIAQQDIQLQSSELPARFSVAYFAKPNRTSSVKSLPEMCGEGEVPRYEDLTAGEFLLQRSWTGYGVAG
ncbi:isopenicillin N synthase [Penicillium lagena]|uniref:isopenicillin N synthase n=1 Tax=Penicillium lagena TaxID=94218 RepID=UPI0025413933|nr:isopenicillin N synthase [Penicillium lagena]KAJ5612605.1 isopenicillin N synthase [Penicillium lagena]